MPDLRQVASLRTSLAQLTQRLVEERCKALPLRVEDKFPAQTCFARQMSANRLLGELQVIEDQTLQLSRLSVTSY